MTVRTFAAAAAALRPRPRPGFAPIASLLDAARGAAASDLLALPEARLGGYLSSRGHDGIREAPTSLPPALDVDGPEMRAGGRPGGRPVVVVGFCELDASASATTARSP